MIFQPWLTVMCARVIIIDVSVIRKYVALGTLLAPPILIDVHILYQFSIHWRGF